MLPQKILKSRSSEMQFPAFWTSNRAVFTKIFVAIWRLFFVKNRGPFTSHNESQISDVKTGKCCETGNTVFRPHPRRLECLIICRCETKAAHSTQLF